MGCKLGIGDRNADDFEKFCGLCPFCRAPVGMEVGAEVTRVKKRMEMNDAYAFYSLGVAYAHGNWALPVDLERAIPLYEKAAELGCASASYDIGSMYCQGLNVAKDEEKGMRHLEIAAIGGSLDARHALGSLALVEFNAKGDAELLERALKHLKIAAKAGHEQSLKPIRLCYPRYVTKEEYASVLRAYQQSKDDIKSDAREKAAEINRLNESRLQARDPIVVRDIAQQLRVLHGLGGRT